MLHSAHSLLPSLYYLNFVGVIRNVCSYFFHFASSSIFVEYLHHDFSTISIHDLDHSSFISFIAHCSFILVYSYTFIYLLLCWVLYSTIIYFSIDHVSPLKNFLKKICRRYIFVLLCLLINFFCFVIMIITVLII